MQHICGISREQISFTSLDSFISADNPVRFIDAFVLTIDLQKIGFAVQTLKKEGRPSFQSTVFLKLYLYGYIICKECAARHLCTSKADGRREIDRSEFAQAIEENNKRYQTQYELYRKRQEINEHIFGTIKRQWGYNHTNLRGLEKVNGEHSLIMLVYNIKRAINILGMKDLIEKLKKWKSPYKRSGYILFFTTHVKPHYGHLNFHQKTAA